MCKDTAAVCKGAREDKSIGRSTDRRTDRIASQLPKTHFTGDVYKPSTVVPVPPATAVGGRGPRTRGINRAGPSPSVGPRNKESPRPQTPLFSSLFFVFPLSAASSSVGASAAVIRGGAAIASRRRRSRARGSPAAAPTTKPASSFTSCTA